MATEAFVIAISTTGTREVTRDLQNIGTSGQNASKQLDQVGAASTRTAKSVDALRGSLSLMRNLLVAFSFVRAISGLTEMINTAQLLQNKLITVTSSQDQMRAVMEAVAQTSIRTRTSLDSNVDTLVRLARSTGSLHLSWQQLIDIERGIADTVHIAGASTQQASRALMDFAEGLAAGSLQGRQLRAMVMQLPTLGDAIAKSFGLAGAQLMHFLKMNPGALTPEAIVKALQAALPQLDAMIGKTNVTIGQAFQNLHTRLILYVQDMDAAWGISQKVNTVLTYIGDHISAIAKFVATLAAIAALNIVVGIIGSLLTNFGFLFAVVNFLTGGLLKLGIALVALPFRVLSVGIALFGELGGVLTGVGTVVQSVIQFVSGLVTVLAGGLTNLVAFLSVSVTEAIASVGTSIVTMGAGLVVMGGAAVIAYTAISGLLAPLAQIAGMADPFKGMNISLKDLPVLFESAFDTIVNNFPIVTKALSALWDDMVSGMENRLGNLGNETARFMTDPFGLLPHVGISDLTPFNTGRPTNTAAPILNQLADDMKGRFIMNREVAAGIVPDQSSQLSGSPVVQAGKTLPDVNKNAASQFAAAQTALQNFLRQFSPYAAMLAKIDEFNKLVIKSTKAHVDVLGELEKAGIHANSIDDARRKLLVLVQREVLGLGNEEMKAAQQEVLLNKARSDGILLNNEYERTLLKIREAQLAADPTNLALGIEVAQRTSQVALQNKGDIAKSVVGGALDFQTTPTMAAAQIDALNKALEKGVIDGPAYAHAMIGVLQSQRDLSSGEQLAFLQSQEELLNKGAIAAEALKTVYDQFNSGAKLAIQLQAINDAMAKNPALTEKAVQAIRDLQIAYLNTQTDALSGFQRGLLEAQKSMNDFATTAANTVTQAFNDMTDALTTFFDTGKVDFSTLVNDIQTNLTKLAVQQTIMGPLANMMGFNQQGQGGVAGSGGILSSLFGGSGLGGAFGVQLGASASNPMYVTFATPLGSLTGGGSGGMFGGSSGGMFGSGGIFGSGGFFSNLFNGGGGAGTSSQGIADFFSSIFGSLGFAGGGSFEVGGSGHGGTDSVPVGFMASPGEIVHVSKGGEDSGDTQQPQVNVQMHVHGVSDKDSFQRSESQVAASLGAQLSRHIQRSGK